MASGAAADTLRSSLEGLTSWAASRGPSGLALAAGAGALVIHVVVLALMWTLPSPPGHLLRWFNGAASLAHLALGAVCAVVAPRAALPREAGAAVSLAYGDGVVRTLPDGTPDSFYTVDMDLSSLGRALSVFGAAGVEVRAEATLTEGGSPTPGTFLVSASAAGPSLRFVAAPREPDPVHIEIVPPPSSGADKPPGVGALRLALKLDTSAMDTTWRLVAQVPEPACDSMRNLFPAWLTQARAAAAFCVLTSLAHALLVLFHVPYEAALASRLNPVRWAEYSVTSPIMMTMLSNPLGITAAPSVFSVFLTTSVTNVFGLAVDAAESYQAAATYMLAGYLVFVVAWLYVGERVVFFLRAAALSERAPRGFADAAAIGGALLLAVLYLLFPAIQAGQVLLSTPDNHKYLLGELFFLLSSLFSKTTLVALAVGLGYRPSWTAAYSNSAGPPRAPEATTADEKKKA